VVPPSVHIRVGIDILAVERVSRLLRENVGIEDEVFTPRELDYCRGRSRPDEHLAARFAAKEAAIKALGAALSAREIEVEGGAREAPRLRLHGRADALAADRGLELQLSLTHSQEMAAAVVVAEPTGS
jgi:holo-[acyl-carrier protein] synthase